MLAVGDQVRPHAEFLSPAMTCSFEQIGNISIFLVDDANATDHQPYLDVGEPNNLIIHSPTLNFKANDGLFL